MSLRSLGLSKDPKDAQRQPYRMISTDLWYLQVCYQISTESLWYLHIYGIYSFATRYLWIPMTSTKLYDNYVLYKNFQSLLMKMKNY